MLDPLARHAAWMIELAAINAEIDLSDIPAPARRPTSKRQRRTKRAPWWEECTAPLPSLWWTKSEMVALAKPVCEL